MKHESFDSCFFVCAWQGAHSESSYGFRPGRSAHQAVLSGRSYQHEEKRWVVDMDLASFFDEVNHDILMSRIGRRVKDRKMLRLILWCQWKRPWTRFKKLRKFGLPEKRAALSAFNGRGPWYNSEASYMNAALP